MSAVNPNEIHIPPPDRLIDLLARLLCLSSQNGIVLQPEDVEALSWILIVFRDRVRCESKKTPPSQGEEPGETLGHC